MMQADLYPRDDRQRSKECRWSVLGDRYASEQHHCGGGWRNANNRILQPVVRQCSPKREMPAGGTAGISYSYSLIALVDQHHYQSVFLTL